jgi:pimeloyl-ACP methyl ester carboxylesterase
MWAGYADMMAEPHEARLTRSAVKTLVDWLQDAHPRLEPASRPPLLPPWPRGFSGGAWREQPVAFGPRATLYGVVTEPQGEALGQHPRADTAVLMLTVGGNYHVGCNRIYVKAARELAAAGYQVLRFDLAGMGDSQGEQTGDSMYRHRSVADVRAAIDLMSQRGCGKVWLLGICSGSYLAFETALQDARVTGQMLLNSRLLEWDTAANGPWQTAMQAHYKSTRYYKQRLFSTEVYTRLVRGQVDVSGIARRLWGIASQRARRAVDTLLRRAPQEGVLRKMQHLSARGVKTFVVMSAEDDGLDYIEFHLGRRGSLMRGQPGFRMALIEDSDHTFSTVSSQRAVIDLVRHHLDATHEVQGRASATARVRAATT